MRKTIPWLLLAILLALPTLSMAIERGIKVSVKTQDGGSIALYENSYALVIGNGNYTNGWDPLPGALKDADDVAKALERNGFQVTLKKNLTKSAFNATLSAFSTDYGREPKNRLLFYYAGHGFTQKLSTDEELGFLVMVDAPAPERDPYGFRLASVDMQSIVTEARIMNAKHVLFMFDSCFSGSILNLRDRVVPQNISDNVKYPVRQFITAGRANEPVPDHSVFKQAFLDLLEGRDREPIADGYITGEELGLYLKTKVPEYNPVQHPQYGKIRDPRLDKGDFVFVAGGSAVIRTPEPPTPSEPMTGSLKVETSPSGAMVYVNNGRVNVSPIKLSGLTPAKVTVRAELKGYRDREEQVWIQAGKETKVTLYLDRIPTTGVVSVESEPSGARWYLDGTYVGVTPGEMSDVEQGSHRISVKKDGYKDWEQPVQVAAARRHEISAKLPPIRTGPELGQEWKDPVTGMEFVWVPESCYEMGCGSWTSDCDGDEKPVHEVCLDGFWMGKYEVTQGQWKTIMAGNPSNFKKGDNYPVETVSWTDAKEFIEKLNNRSSGGQYRLPTEAEWEYACRSGGKGEKYSGSSDVDRVAWYGYEKSGISTHPVGTKASNGLGIYDMSGNVWEWCEDVYDSSAYSKHSRKNPVVTSGGSLRVVRGGGWYDDPRYVRCADRNWDNPGLRSRYLGFRLLRTP